MLELVASGEAALVVGTHAVIQEQVQFKRAGAGHHRRAAPLRRGAAAGAARQDDARAGQRTAPADDVGHADPAHAGHELLRRPGRLHHRRTAAGPHAGGHQADRRQPARRGDRAHPRASWREGRQVYWVCPLIEESESAGPDQRHRHARGAERGAARRDGRPAAFAHAGAGEEGGDGAVHRRADGRAGVHHRDRGRASTCPMPR